MSPSLAALVYVARLGGLFSPSQDESVRTSKALLMRILGVFAGRF